MNSTDGRNYLRRRRTKSATEHFSKVNRVEQSDRMNSVNGVVCNDCGNLIPQSQVDNWLNPHIWRPPTPYYVVRREDRGRARVRSAASAPPDERPSARRRVVQLMEIGGDDTLEELRRLMETIEAARNPPWKHPSPPPARTSTRSHRDGGSLQTILAVVFRH